MADVLTTSPRDSTPIKHSTTVPGLDRVVVTVVDDTGADVVFGGGGGGDVSIVDWLGSTAPTVGQKTMADSLPVAIASDQSPVPISASSLPLPTGAATEATLASILAGQLPDNHQVEISNFPATQPVSLEIEEEVTNLDTEITVTNSATTLALANADRKRLFIQNHGSENIRVRLAAGATTSSPIRLAPRLGAYELIPSPYIYNGIVTAISETATSCLVGVWETV